MSKVRSEDEIMVGWQGGNSEGGPLVTILCFTYNHAPYIGDALEGMLAQETSFPFEIVINDDASSDGARDILQDYMHRYPRLIRARLHDRNQLSLGIPPLQHTLSLCQGRYTALCEGDDAWTDPGKLERQVSMLETHPECDMAFHAAKAVEFGCDHHRKIGDFGDKPRVVSAEEVIEKRLGSIPTASVIVRTSVLHELLRFMEGQEDKIVFDAYLDPLASRRGGACYLPECMSLYRFRLPGSWSGTMEQGGDQLLHYRRRVHSNRRMDIWLKSRFSRSFRVANRDMIMKAMKHSAAPVDRRRCFYQEFCSELGLREKVMARCLLAWPGGIDHYRSWRSWWRRQGLSGGARRY